MTGLERLKRLAVVLEAVKADPEKERLFDMSTWSTEHPCGTSACACGWGAVDPVLSADGLHLVPVRQASGRTWKEIAFGEWRAFAAARVFFEISADDADNLFSDLFYDGDDEPSVDDVLVRLNAFIEKTSSTPSP